MSILKFLSGKWYSRKLRNRTWNGIDDMPIYNWWKVSSGELMFVLKEGEVKMNAATGKILNEKWERIYDSYLLHFGFSEDFLRQLEKKKHIALLDLKMVETDDFTIQTDIDILRIELAQMVEESSGKTDFYETKSMMEMNLGFTLDPRKITVREFYSYIKNLKKYSKQKHHG